jgi:hypothetical protein
MRGGLGGIIGLGFDDSSAYIVHEQPDPDEIARHDERTAAEESGIERRAFLPPGSLVFHASFSWLGLCAAIFPDLSLLTMYSGLSLEAGDLTFDLGGGCLFFTALPRVSPCDVFHTSLSPLFNCAIACSRSPLTRQLACETPVPALSDWRR